MKDTMRYRYLLPAFVTMLAWQCAFTQPALLPIQEFIGTWNQGLGGTVVALGDVNGDSLPDIGLPDNRSFLIYFGGKSVLDDAPDAIYPVDAGGYVVNAVVGDFNGDGLTDLVLAQHWPNSMDTVKIYFGIPSPGLQLETEPRIQIPNEGTQGGKNFGWSMAVGDLNRDGYDDLVISARNQVTPELRVGGKVYVYMGKPNFTGVPDFTGIGNDYAASDLYGSSVQIQNVNGDSFPDLIFGSIYNRMNHPDSLWKRLHIHLGGTNFIFESDKPHQLIESRRFDFGDVRRWYIESSSIVDVNNDGLADMYATHQDWTRLNAFVFLSTRDSIKLYPEIFIPKPSGTDGIWSGRSFYSAGDLNGDSHKDFALRVAPISKLVFYQGSHRGLELFPFAQSQYGFNQSFGRVVTLVGDQNGDGVDDIGVNSSNSNTSNGGAIILAGNRNLPVGIEVIDNIARDPTIHSAYPNPFHAYTNITIENEQPGNATVVVTDALGRVVRRVHEGELHAGKCSLRWDGTTDRGSLAPSGVYFYRVIMGNEVTSGPLFLIRH